MIQIFLKSLEFQSSMRIVTMIHKKSEEIPQKD